MRLLFGLLGHSLADVSSSIARCFTFIFISNTFYYIGYTLYIIADIFIFNLICYHHLFTIGQALRLDDKRKLST